MSDKIIRIGDDQSDVFCTPGRMLDQDVIDPRDTRHVLGSALQTCWESRNRQLNSNSAGVARL